MVDFVNQTAIRLHGQVFNITDLWFNGTVFNTTACTVDTCSLELASFLYLPTIPGNAFLAIFFAVILLLQIPLGIYFRTWGVLAAMVLGLALEIVGYVGRIWIHSSPFTQNPFLINIIGLTIGPAFLAAAIYLCLSRIIVVYGESFSRFKPRTYSVSFMIADFVALVLQGAGGGIASTANDQATSDMGVDIMIAGLAWQVVSITLFGIVCADFAWRVRSGRGQKNPLFTSLRESTKWTLFLLAIGLATTTIYIRSIYRVAELSFGFHSSFANQEAQFMILEGGMIGIAVLCLTVFHPGLVFRRQWRAANFSIGGKAKGIKETGWESGSDRSAAEVEMGRVYDPRRG